MSAVIIAHAGSCYIVVSMAAPVVFTSWYRPRIIGAVLRATLRSAVLTVGGMVLVGLALWSHRVGPELRPFVLIVGGVATLAGPVSLMWRLGRLVVSDDVFVGLATTGVDVRSGEARRFLPWDEITRVVVAESGQVEIQLRTGQPVRLVHEFDGVSHAELAREMERLRQRVALGLTARGGNQ